MIFFTFRMIFSPFRQLRMKSQKLAIPLIITLLFDFFTFGTSEDEEPETSHTTLVTFLFFMSAALE